MTAKQAVLDYINSRPLYKNIELLDDLAVKLGYSEITIRITIQRLIGAGVFVPNTSVKCVQKYHELFPISPSLPAPVKAIAEATGFSQVTVGKAIRQLRRQGVVPPADQVAITSNRSNALKGDDLVMVAEMEQQGLTRKSIQERTGYRSETICRRLGRKAS